MSNIDMSGLTPAQASLTDKALNKLVRINGKVMSWRDFVESLDVIEKSVMDGSIDFNRRHFNSLDYAGQAAYEARLKAKRYYCINDTIVPKRVYDVTVVNEVLQPGQVWANEEEMNHLFGVNK